MPGKPKRLRMVRARLNDDEFTDLKQETKKTGASISSIIRDALTERRLRVSSAACPPDCGQENR